MHVQAQGETVVDLGYNCSWIEQIRAYLELCAVSVSPEDNVSHQEKPPSQIQGNLPKFLEIYQNFLYLAETSSEPDYPSPVTVFSNYFKLP